MESVLGHVTCSDNIFSWNFSRIDLIMEKPPVRSPSFSHKGCSWYIQVPRDKKRRLFAVLARDSDEGPETISVSFVLGYRWDNGALAEDPWILNYIFWRHCSAGQCYFLRHEHPLNMASSSMVTITCRFLEKIAGQVRLFPVQPVDLNPEVDTWKKKFNEAQSTISKLRAEICVLSGLLEENKSSMKETENLKKLNKDLELETLSFDFQELLRSENKSDVVLHVMGREFPAHKSVLVARSPVLRATFSHDSEEEKTGMVTIPDCDPESFPLFLNFLYSGRVGELTVDTALQLYATSDKYDVQALKSICSDHLKRNLTPESVCDVAVLADLHFDDGLMSAAQLYFNENYISILQTSEWTATLKKYPRISDKMLKEMASGVGKKPAK